MSIRYSYDSRILPFWKPASISSYQPELDQNPITTLASYPFPEIELEDECEPELQVSDSSPFIESLSTPVVLPKISDVLEPVLIPIFPELDSTISPFTYLLWTKIKIPFHYIHLNLPKILKTTLTF